MSANCFWQTWTLTVCATARAAAQSLFLADERFGDRFKLSKNDCGAHHQPSSAKKGCILRVGRVGHVGQLFIGHLGRGEFFDTVAGAA
ncbi:MAG: hypothetical protein C0485_02810 [Pirellula sp.]|nr:hypothetical protein [Pirellula sp.]